MISNKMLELNSTVSLTRFMSKESAKPDKTPGTVAACSCSCCKSKTRSINCKASPAETNSSTNSWRASWLNLSLT
ncbi:hypothetical protein WICPIJ_000701 [Wickerhamomyces pijperi]|uniref:Uncharacterized protein n=1 Tax=Wickerhamomyces pijperi TaxID=599730 RepID=A0A9P8QG87_WICPI|nr:hypothetical protein WICPIJ_000701 [Wickerhamomyces pijperi]